MGRNPWKAEELHVSSCWHGNPEPAWLGTVRWFFQKGKGQAFDEFKGWWELSCPWFACCRSASYLKRRSAFVLKSW